MSSESFYPLCEHSVKMPIVKKPVLKMPFMKSMGSLKLMRKNARAVATV